MKQFGLRYLYKHLGQALKEIPFEITNHNRVIAVVNVPEVVEVVGGGDRYDYTIKRIFQDGREEILDKVTNKWK